MSRWIRLLAMTLALLAFGACSSTKLVDSWKAPGLTGPVSFDKIVVVFMSPDKATRLAAEDELAGLIQSTESMTSYAVFGAGKPADEKAAAEELKVRGFDGAIVMRIVSKDKELSYSPGMTYPGPYRSFGGYYGWGWGMAYDPGYLRTDTIVSVETNVYDLGKDELLYSSVSETFNPSNARKMVDDVARAVGKDLQARGLI